MVRSLRLGALAMLAASVLMVPTLAAAQSSNDPTGTNATGTSPSGNPSSSAPNASTSSQTLAQLQRKALRLTLIARLPAADQQQAGQLLDRADALRQRALTLRRQELQAYVAALEGGATPANARTQAQQKVAVERTSLTKAAATLRADVQSFLQRVPQARTLLRSLGAGLRERAQALGRGPGRVPGNAPGLGPWSGRGQGMGRGTVQGMRQGMRQGMAPGDNGRADRAGRGWARDGAPYGQGDAPWGPAMRQGLGHGRMGPNGMGRGCGWMDRSWMDRSWMGPDGMGLDGMGPNWMGRSWMGRDWMGRDWMAPNGSMPGQGPRMTPRNGAPRNSAPQNATPPSSTPPSSTPPSTTPPSTTPPSGSGTGGA